MSFAQTENGVGRRAPGIAGDGTQEGSPGFQVPSVEQVVEPRWSEIFDARVRYTGMAVSTQFATVALRLFPSIAVARKFVS